jgi:hypothetical protein
MSAPDQPRADEAATTVPSLALERPFGEENRTRLLGEYFQGRGRVEPAETWRHVYRLLLWVDRTTGLAHCYESDKSQPGRPWYARSLAFHDWVSTALGTAPSDLGDHIDVLFRRATADLATAAAARRAVRTADAAAQREPYAGRGLPEPGEDPELEAIITDALKGYLATPPSAEVLRKLTERIQSHVGQENKRKNLVGEGFEDTVAALLRRMPGVIQAYDVHTRPLLHDLPGFRPPRAGSKSRQVDLALVHRTTGQRTLVSCKWSVRSDREEQFASDFRDYAELEDAGRDFSYVLITNEFDPARLAAACEMRRQNAPLFADVVHVNTDGPRAAYAAPTRGQHRGERSGITRALRHIDTRRLLSLGPWTNRLGVP